MKLSQGELLLWLYQVTFNDHKINIESYYTLGDLYGNYYYYQYNYYDNQL